MKPIILCFAVLSSSMHFLTAQNNHSITVEFSNLKQHSGNLFIGLYDSETNFLKHRFRETAIAVHKDIERVTFKNIPDGTYAISSYHDVNDNGKMDTRFSFIPKEPVGTSNNAKGKFGPPKFADAKFMVNKDLKLKITMRKP